MTSEIRISEAELQVMQCLWEEHPLGAREIAERLPQAPAWSLTTVKTLLSRLVAKGAVSTTQQGRSFCYKPAIERSTVVGGQAQKLVDRLFGGRLSPLVAQLAEQTELDPDDLAELEKLVRELRK